MMNDHHKAHRPKGHEGPHVREDGDPAHGRTAGSGDAGFADRLRLYGSLSSSMLRYPGPRDYCGFEAPALGEVEERPMGGVMGSPNREPRSEWVTNDWELDDRKRPASGEPGRWISEDSADEVKAVSGTVGAPVERHQSIPVSRPRRPKVPGYEILEELGRGGMGVVYKARQLRLNRLVALKMILAGEYAGTDALERFLAEAEIVARLRHPNIVQIHAIGDFEGQPYVELEYIEGGSLSSRLEGTPWPPRAAARLVESLASALAEAHRMGIVHRDLKPANILMTDEGTPKITDFGLAKSSDKDIGLTKTDSILGSPSYMSPEQAEGRAKDVGPLADIYALGANLYELLTGRPPFVGPTILTTLDLVKNAEPVPPRHLQPGLPSDLDTICLKCLRKEPQRRYESTDALAEDLRRYLNGEPILARPTPHWERAWKWVRRRPATAALVVVTVLSILAAAGGGLWYRADQDRQRAAVRRHVEGVREQVNLYILLGEEAMPPRGLGRRRTQMSSRPGPGLHRAEAGRDGRRGIAACLAVCDAKIADRQARLAARARLAAFQRSYDEAHVLPDPVHGPGARGQPPGEPSRGSARPSNSSSRHVVPVGARPRLRHLRCVGGRGHHDAYYELALILAEAGSQPMAGEEPSAQAREALRILDRVERVRPPTKVFWLRRAEYLLRAGDREGAEARATT